MTTQPATANEVPLQRPSGALQFGNFHLYPARRQLMRDEEDVRIGARAFDLLMTLAARAGEIISHAELIAAAWPNRVVSECNLKAQIASLQKILGEAPMGGRYIKSVTLRGYMFVGDVRRTTRPDAIPANGFADIDWLNATSAPRCHPSHACSNGCSASLVTAGFSADLSQIDHSCSDIDRMAAGIACLRTSLRTEFDAASKSLAGDQDVSGGHPIGHRATASNGNAFSSEGIDCDV